MPETKLMITKELLDIPEISDIIDENILEQHMEDIEKAFSLIQTQTLEIAAGENDNMAIEIEKLQEPIARSHAKILRRVAEKIRALKPEVK